MKVHYRGYEISVDRGDSPYKPTEGLCYVYWSIYRESDGYCCDETYSYGCETVQEWIEILKRRIDNELATGDPWMENEEEI
jgi:hypothetical protein